MTVDFMMEVCGCGSWWIVDCGIWWGVLVFWLGLICLWCSFRIYDFGDMLLFATLFLCDAAFCVARLGVVSG